MRCARMGTSQYILPPNYTIIARLEKCTRSKLVDYFLP